MPQEVVGRNKVADTMGMVGMLLMIFAFIVTILLVANSTMRSSLWWYRVTVASYFFGVIGMGVKRFMGQS